MDILFLQCSLKNKNPHSEPDMAICPFFVSIANLALKLLSKKTRVIIWEMRPFFWKTVHFTEIFYSPYYFKPRKKKYHGHIICLTHLKRNLCNSETVLSAEVRGILCGCPAVLLHWICVHVPNRTTLPHFRKIPLSLAPSNSAHAYVG